MAGTGADPFGLAAGTTEVLCRTDSIVPIDRDSIRLVQTIDVGAPEAGESVYLPLEELGIRNISGTMGVVNRMLIKLEAWHKLPAATLAIQTLTFK